jgi:histidyl-tRNA synthetase
MKGFQTVKGMRDFSPEEMEKRQFVLDIIRRVFENWGFLPLDTPALESFGLLAAKGGGGEEVKKEIYYFKDQGGRELGMRFDLTVPTARFIASNPGLVKPFKRYQFGKVWRYDQPQKDRFREFQQTDVDIFGSSSPKSDAEIVGVACDVFKSLGFKNFTIRINNRKLVESFIVSLGVKDFVDVFRSIDKMDKIGEKGVTSELKKKKVSDKNIKAILKFVEGGKIPNLEGKEELDAVMNEVKLLGFSKNVKVDLSLIRGLEYYTGCVFEVSLGGKVSVAGGGRFDNMVEKFGGQKTPAVGISLGFERIVNEMERKKMFKVRKKRVMVIGVNDDVRKDVLSIADSLRSSGLLTEIDVMDRNFRKQLDYASKRGMESVVIVGPKELKEKKVVVKNMITGKEKKVSITNLVKSFV